MAADATIALDIESAITPFGSSTTEVMGTFGYSFDIDSQAVAVPTVTPEVMGIFGIRLGSVTQQLPGGDSSGGGGGGGTGGGIARPSAGMIYPRGSG